MSNLKKTLADLLASDDTIVYRNAMSILKQIKKNTCLTCNSTGYISKKDKCLNCIDK